MPRLSIAVVDDRVEEGEWAQRLVGAVHQANRLLNAAVFNPELHRPLACGTVAQDRWRHHVQRERLAQLVCGDLTCGEGAIRKIPERLLAAHRLVDHAIRRVTDLTEQGEVARVDELADGAKFRRTVEQLKRLRRCNRPSGRGEWLLTERRRAAQAATLSSRPSVEEGGLAGAGVTVRVERCAAVGAGLTAGCCELERLLSETKGGVDGE